MSIAIGIYTSGYCSKKEIKRVSKSLENAKTSIKKANDHLYNVGSSRVTKERSNLTDIYNKDNIYESSFDNFAIRLENCVNDLIEVDKKCANRIYKNGRKHRKQNGLPKSLLWSTIDSTFIPLENIVKNIANGIEDFIDDILDEFGTLGDILNWIGDKWAEDWDSILQMIEGIGGTLAAGAILIAGLFTSASVAPVIMAGAAVALFFGVDKTLSGLIDVMDKEETNGGSLYKNAIKGLFKDSKLWGWVVDGVYEAGDLASSLIVSGGSSIIKELKPKSLLKAASKIDDALKAVLDTKYVKKSKDALKYFRNITQPNVSKFLDSKIYKTFKGNIMDALIKKGYIRGDKNFYVNTINNIQVDHERALELASRKSK